MKRVLASVCTVFLLLFALIPTAWAAEPAERFEPVATYQTGQFTDVAEGSWYFAHVKSTYELGLFKGVTETTFAPDRAASLAECIVLAARLHSIYHTGQADFPQSGIWYQAYVEYAVANNIISAADFPVYEQNATRREAAYIFARALPDDALSPINNIDADAIPDVAETDPFGAEIYILYRAGILTGIDDSRTFLPEGELQRSSLAAIMARMTDPSLRVQLTLPDTTSYSLPKLYFEGNIAEMQSKSDVRNITVSYDDGENSFEGFATLKVQGTSSLMYDKKNYTIKLYADAECTEKMKVNVGWGDQNEYCLKANWIDKTHARNIITANIVTEVQDKYNLLEHTPANGAIDGFPIEIYINGEFLGLYTFNIPKDDWMFAMDSDNPDHIVVCSEGWDPANLFLEPANFTAWSVEVGEENDATLAKLNRVFDFVINSTDEEFKTQIHEYINLDAALNYYVLTDFAYLWDNMSKNMLLVTYDGNVWYPSLYDLDTSWGTNWQGVYLLEYWNASLDLSVNNLFARLEKNFSKELSQRYFELREDILTKEHVLEKFRSFEASIPNEVFEKEVARWGTAIPGYDISQIEIYLNTVLPRLDREYAELGGSQ